MDTLVPGKGLRSQDRAPGSATSRDQAGPQGNSPQEMQKPARERRVWVTMDPAGVQEEKG